MHQKRQVITITVNQLLITIHPTSDQESSHVVFKLQNQEKVFKNPKNLATVSTDNKSSAIIRRKAKEGDAPPH